MCQTIRVSGGDIGVTVPRQTDNGSPHGDSRLERERDFRQCQRPAAMETSGDLTQFWRANVGVPFLGEAVRIQRVLQGNMQIALETKPEKPATGPAGVEPGTSRKKSS